MHVSYWPRIICVLHYGRLLCSFTPRLGSPIQSAESVTYLQITPTPHPKDPQQLRLFFAYQSTPPSFLPRAPELRPRQGIYIYPAGATLQPREPEVVCVGEGAHGTLRQSTACGLCGHLAPSVISCIPPSKLWRQRARESRADFSSATSIFYLCLHTVLRALEHKPSATQHHRIPYIPPRQYSTRSSKEQQQWWDQSIQCWCVTHTRKAARRPEIQSTTKR